MTGPRTAPAPRPCRALLVLALAAAAAGAQDVEPRRWTPLPTGTNIAGLGYVFTAGDLFFDPALRIEDADVRLNTVLASFNHYFALFGETARIDVQVPWHSGNWEGLLDGAPASRSRVGFGDPRIRLSTTLAGAPALGPREFQEHRRQHENHTVVGAAVGVRLPLGEYSQNRLINLGQNRWVIEPQLGVVHTRGPWSYELTGSAFFYTDNDEFFRGSDLAQDALFAVQAHVVRTLDSGVWLGGGAAYGWAGESVIDGAGVGDDKSNLLYGLSIGFPCGANQSMRVAYLRGDSLADVGMDSHSVLVTWSLRF